MKAFILKSNIIYITFSIVLSIAFVLSLTVGAVSLNFADIVNGWLGSASNINTMQNYVLFELRLPRTITAVLVGAGLAAAGVCTQGLFRNPLADPSLIGVSSGSAFGAVLVIVLGSQWADMADNAWLEPLLLPMAAFVGGMLASLVVYNVASNQHGTDTALLLLAGVAINAICGAATGLLTYIANDNQLRDLTFWSMGSVAKNDWSMLMVSGPIIVICSGLLLPYRSALNSLLMGENVAQHIGFEVAKIKRYLILLCSIIVGASVAISGVILFVGLVVPHILRSLLGPDHRLLLPAAMFLGAILVLIADIFSRSIIAPAELPIGLFMSLLGGPFFLFLLIKQRSRF